MGRGVASDDLLSPIVLDYSAAQEQRTLVRSTTWPTVAVVTPPFSRQIARAADMARRARFRYAIVIANNRDSDPRMRSTVEHRISRRADEVVDLLSRDRGRRFAYDTIDREYRLPVDLRLAWSWPRLPMWLGVGELSRAQCALRLSLRSRRRIRYPARYFYAAHSLLDGLTRRLDGPIGSQPSGI
jgi:hypothetical protein